MKTKIFAVTFILSILSVVSVFAQENPCGDLGPDDVCPVPLDTWVWVLVAAALVFVTVQLHRKQRGGQATAIAN
jgi:hypothetical protein